MEIYAYQAIDQSGKTVAGQMEADDDWLVADRLRKMGLTVIEISKVKTSAAGSFFRGHRKVGIGDLGLFTRQLAAMLEAGIPLTRALFTLGRQAANPALREAVNATARDVESGAGFADALSVHSNIFPSLYIDMVRAGEVGGSLEGVLRRLSDQLAQDKALRDQMRTATFYPAVIISFATLVVLGMMFFIVPIFMKFFPPGMTLPLPTRIIIALSNSLRHGWYLWLLGAAAAYTGVRFYLRSPLGSRTWDRVKLRLPIFGPLIQRAVMARFARTLSTLLAGGIPVVQALETAGPTAGSSLVAAAVSAAAEKIQEGKSIAAPLEESGIFPPMVTQMVAVGEESGTLPTLLTRVAEFYEAEVAAMAKGLTALIEPVLIIVVGGVVAFMVISMYLPIFYVVTSVGR
ncbi:MAG: type II secretion system F family protein [Bacillota bacterium]